LGERSILEVIPLLDAEFLRFLRLHPEELRNVNPRRFEEIVAGLFAGFGFEVELTAMARDGGRDLVAVKYEPARVKYLVECKRYVPPNKVGIAVVQRLHGVTLSEGASKGILATTSYFSAPAKLHIEKHPFILDGRDYDGLTRWLDLYDKTRMANILLP
jgi:restriction endonuclease Mrr